MATPEFEKEILKTMLEELADNSNSNKSKIKQLRDTTKLISAEMIEYLIEKDMLDIFERNGWGGIFAPQNYFVQIEVPENLLKVLDADTHDRYIKIKNTLTLSFLKLKMDPELIRTYPNAFKYEHFQPNKYIFEVLLEKYEDINFNYSDLDGTIRKRLAGENPQNPFLEKYMHHINFSDCNGAQLSTKVKNFLKDSVHILDTNIGRKRFASFLTAIPVFIKDGYSALDSIKQLDQEGKLLVEEKNEAMRIFFKNRLSSLSYGFNSSSFLMLGNLYQIGMDVNDLDLGDFSLIPFNSITNNYQVKSIIDEIIKNELLKDSAYNSHSGREFMDIILNIRLLFDDEDFFTQLYKISEDVRRYGVFQILERNWGMRNEHSEIKEIDGLLERIREKIINDKNVTDYEKESLKLFLDHLILKIKLT